MIQYILPTNKGYNSLGLMSLGCDSVNHSGFRYSLVCALLALSGHASAIGFGELRGAPALGERPRLEIQLLGSGLTALDSTCFRLTQPSANSGLPWLNKGTLSIRRGNPPVLQITSHIPVTDPVFVVAVDVACGYDVVREYVVFASPPSGKALISSGNAPLVQAPATAPVQRSGVAPERSYAPRPPAAPAVLAPAPAPVVPGDPVVASEEKVRLMEAQVASLQQRASDLTQKIEQTSAPAAQVDARPVSETPPAAPQPTPSSPPVRNDTSGSNWLLYSALIGALLAIAGWLGWRSYRERQMFGGAGGPELQVDPQRLNEREERGGVDLDVEPAAMALPVKLDLKPDAPTAPIGQAVAPDVTSRADSMMSVAAASVDEHFEANPVMELAEIMLSFGRVKGAAQALQEYIDSNPQEALKPWIRLMDVYRMAGMRHEFEKVARELNKNFNVQVQKWDEFAESPDQPQVDVVLDAEPASSAAVAVVDGIEDMPAILEQVLLRWPANDVVAWLNQLLRDNRGGTRIGFALPVVSDILFLIELKEVSIKIESESESS